MPIEVEGRCDSFGDPRPDGAFLRLVYVATEARHGILLTEPEALQLVASIANGLNRVLAPYRRGPPF